MILSSFYNDASRNDIRTMLYIAIVSRQTKRTNAVSCALFYTRDVPTPLYLPTTQWIARRVTIVPRHTVAVAKPFPCRICYMPRGQVHVHRCPTCLYMCETLHTCTITQTYMQSLLPSTRPCQTVTENNYNRRI